MEFCSFKICKFKILSSMNFKKCVLNKGADWSIDAKTQMKKLLLREILFAQKLTLFLL